MKTLQQLQTEKEECETKINKILMDFSNSNSLASLSLDFEVSSGETTAGRKIFSIKTAIIAGI